jgi:inhibitor of KinA
MNLEKFKISRLGDTAIILNFGDKMDETLNSRVLQLFKFIKTLQLPFVKDVIPAYSSLTIYYDLLILRNAVNKSSVEIFIHQIEKLNEKQFTDSTPSRKIKIPVCYADKYAPDLKDISEAKNLSVEDVILLHTEKIYRVYMIGFLPGFAYMGQVNEKISMPRKEQPRTNVEAGSVGIAGLQTGIYPFDSPGGWQIIGKTPLQLFNKEKNDPVLLQPGDEIEFYSIKENEFTNY